LKKHREGNLTAKDETYQRIRISTLRGDQEIPFDVFLQIAGKHILYIRKGDNFDGVRLKRLKDRATHHIFISTTAEPEYKKYLRYNTELAYKSSLGKPIEVRAQIIQGLQQAATEEVLENPNDQLRYEIFKEDTRKYLEFLLREEKALKCILNLDHGSPSVAHHGVNVASLACSLAIELGEKDANKLQLLTIGALLHDIEHFYSGLNVARPPTEFNSDEKATYHKHPDLGAHRLQNNNFYDQIVLKIILQHHEQINGNGFPGGSREKDIDNFALIVAVADAFDRKITFENVEPKDSIKRMMLDMVGLLPLPLIQGLSQLLKRREIV
jgi:putative nucleotidyltransferase with HDIG domain